MCFCFSETSRKDSEIMNNEKKKIIRGVSISDVHWGAMKPEKLNEELEEFFISTIENMPKLDYIIFNGDFYDKKLSLNEISTKYSLKFMDKVVKIATSKKASIRVVRGTLNHDFYQLDNFKYLELDPTVDFKVINVPTVEKKKGASVLFIPEEYMEDKSEHYSEIFKGNYDMVFLHGIFDHTAFKNQKQESERPIKNSPIFSYDDFKDIVKGFVMCGHIHTKSKYKDLIYYSGSFSRWVFGEEKDKGFYKFSYDVNTSEKKISFIVNEKAPTYKTMDLTQIFQDEKLDLEGKIQKIEKLKKKYDYLRVFIDKDSIDETANMKLIKKYFSESTDLKISIDETIDAVKEQEEEKDDQFSFIFDRHYSFETIVQKFIEIKNGIKIPDDKLKDILFRNVKK